MVHLTRLLAEHALSVDVRLLDDRLKEVTLCCVLDLITAAICGSGLEASKAAELSLGRLYGHGGIPCWFTASKSSLLAAVLHNALASSALDFDDGHRAARGHPGSSVIPTVLTLAAAFPAVGANDILSAIVSGYDVGIRIAAAQTLDGIPTRQSGRWAAFASAAAVGRLLKLSPDRLSEALAIAGVLAPNQRANGSSGYSRLSGNLVKEGIAFSAQTGLQAVFLARQGFTGPVDLLDHPQFYHRDRLVERLGQHFEIADTYFKPYACCRYIHPALDAYRRLAAAHGFGAAEVEKIEVATFRQALRLANSPAPENIVALQYSIPFCLAVFAVDGEAALQPVNDALLHRPDLVAFARTVALQHDDAAEAAFPARTLARLAVTLKSGQRIDGGLIAPRGERTDPMLRPALVDKLQVATRLRLSRANQMKAVKAVACLGEGNAAPLLAFLDRTVASQCLATEE